MKKKPIFFENLFPIIPNGRQELINNQQRITTILDIAIKGNKGNKEYVKFMKMALIHATTLDILSYEVTTSSKNVSDDITRGYDLVIWHFIKTEEQDLATMIYIFREFLHNGQVRFVYPGVYFIPQKERETAIKEIQDNTRNALREEDIRQSNSWELAKNFRVP